MKTLSTIVFALTSVLIAASAFSAAASSAHVQEMHEWRAPQGARMLCQTYSWACETSAGGELVQAGLTGLARDVNVTVNHRIRPQSDSEMYGVTEKWTLPNAGRGDCEDYALLKMKLLLGKGVPSNRLLLALVLNETYVPHIVLILRTDEADYFLDNMTDALLPWHRTGYTVLSMQSAADRSQWSAVFQGPLAQKQQTDRGDAVNSSSLRPQQQISEGIVREKSEPATGFSLVNERRHY